MSITAATQPTQVFQPIGGGIAYLTQLTFAGNYATNGETPSFGAAYKSAQKPYMVMVNPVAGYSFDWDYTNNKLKVYTASTTELAAAGYPAGITAAAVNALVFFHRS